MEAQHITQIEGNNWTGMVGELITGRADLAVTNLDQIWEREEYIDFSKTIMVTG